MKRTPLRPVVAAICIVLGIIAGLRNSLHVGRPHPTGTLTDARRGFHTNLIPVQQDRVAPDTPPADQFHLVYYPSAVGNLAAYVTPDPRDGKRHPAIVWITGGDCNSIGDCWRRQPADNDQSAAQYRAAGIVMVFPSMRGGNLNPGRKEGFLGEVDDVLAAEKSLEMLPYVDSSRIYLGGHSTGGTLALLTAECSDKFRAVFAFGPVDDVSRYDPSMGFVPIRPGDQSEVMLRSPGYWLSSVRSPTWVLEGEQGGNIASLRAMERDNTNPQIHFVGITNASHFSTLAPTNAFIAQKILTDTGPSCSISLTPDEVNRAFDVAR